MRFTTRASIVLALAQISTVVMGSPASPLQRTAGCDFLCKTDADCAGCLGSVDPILQYTCVTLDIPDVDGRHEAHESRHAFALTSSSEPPNTLQGERWHRTSHGLTWSFHPRPCQNAATHVDSSRPAESTYGDVKPVYNWRSLAPVDPNLDPLAYDRPG
ncbi:hypothetical protein VTO73DRAFT_12038 [Trametes versicolor]